MKKIVLVAMIVAAICNMFVAEGIAVSAVDTSAEETETVSIELRTRSILIIDCSVSTEQKIENILSGICQEEYDAVAYFSGGQLMPEKVSAGNSAICQQIDTAIKAGFSHISIITDAEQYPKKYTSLGVYTDIDLTIYMVEEIDTSAEELFEHLKGRMVHSDLKVIEPDGQVTVLLDDYTPPIYDIEIPVPKQETIIVEGECSCDCSNTSAESTSSTEEVSSDTSSDAEPDEQPIIGGTDGTDGEDGGKCRCCCWILWLLLLLLLLLPLLWWLFHHRKGSSDEKLPEEVEEHLKGAKCVLLDVSGSMHDVYLKVVKYLKKTKSNAKIFVFDTSLREVTFAETKKIQPSGATHGWEAISSLLATREDEVTIFTDGGFNGKAFDINDFPRRFSKVTAIVPSGYNAGTIEELKEIADSVEVRYL